MDGKVYISGTSKQGAITLACYWVDGERKILPGGVSAEAIAVVKE